MSPLVRAAKYKSYARVSRMAGVAALLIGLLPQVYWFYLAGEKQWSPTRRDFCDVFSPVYTGLLVLCVGMTEYYLLKFLVTQTDRSHAAKSRSRRRMTRFS